MRFFARNAFPYHPGEPGTYFYEKPAGDNAFVPAYVEVIEAVQFCTAGAHSHDKTLIPHARAQGSIKARNNLGASGNIHISEMRLSSCQLRSRSLINAYRPMA